MPASRYESWGMSKRWVASAVQADDDGNAIMQSEVVPAGHRWRLWTLYIYTNSVAVGEANLYVGDCELPIIAATELEMQSLAGNFDRADGVTSTIYIFGGERMMLVWSGQDPGTICAARMLFEDFREILVDSKQFPLDPTISQFGH